MSDILSERVAELEEENAKLKAENAKLAESLEVANSTVRQIDLLIRKNMSSILEEDMVKRKLEEKLHRSVDELVLSVRARNCIEKTNIKLIGELAMSKERDLLKVWNFGKKCLSEINKILGENGLRLGMDLENFPNPEILKRIHG